jgi:hypothetical protein
MRFFIDQPSPLNGNDLIDAVGKLVTPVLDMDGGAAMRQVVAVDVGYSGHGRDRL